MTFFLNAPQPQEMPMAPQGPAPTLFQGLTASFRRAQIENDSNFRHSREIRSTIADRAQSSLGRLTGVEDEFRRRGIDTGGMLPQEAVRVFPKAAQAVMDMARVQAETNPEAWRDIDLSDENIMAEVNGRLKAEWEDARMISEMAPGMVDFIGGMAGITADIKNLPFFAVGGGTGSFMRVIGREAAINVAAEAAFLPSQFEMSDQLNIPEPDVMTQLAMAAGGGAVLGGLFEATGRGLTYWRARNTVAPIPGYTAADSARAVDIAEDALLAGENPFEALRTLRPTEPVPPPGMEPLILTPQMRDAESVWDEAQAAARGGRAETAEAPSTSRTEAPAAPPTLEELDAQIKELQGTIEEERRRNGLLAAVRAIGIDPGGPVAQSLYARDVRPGRRGTPPGLFSRNGRMNFDNLVRSEWEESFPGITDATGTGWGDMYLDQEGLADVIARATRGDYDWTPGVRQARKAIQEIERLKNGDPIDDFLSGRALEDEGGLFINRDLYDFDTDEFGARAQIAATVERYIDEFDPGLSRAERDEVIAVMQKYGGEVEYALERVHERRAAAVESGADEQVTWIPGFDEPPAAGRAVDDAQTANGQGAGGRSEPETAAGGGNAQGGRGPEDQASQLTIPDTDRVQTGRAQADRATVAAMQQQSRMGRLDQTRVEDDAGGLFGGAQRELFDSPDTARPVLDNIAADIRDTIEREGDFMVDMGDGRGEMRVSAILDDLDAGDEFADAIALCGRPAAKAAE